MEIVEISWQFWFPSSSNVRLGFVHFNLEFLHQLNSQCIKSGERGGTESS